MSKGRSTTRKALVYGLIGFGIAALLLNISFVESAVLGGALTAATFLIESRVTAGSDSDDSATAQSTETIAEGGIDEDLSPGTADQAWSEEPTVNSDREDTARSDTEPTIGTASTAGSSENGSESNANHEAERKRSNSETDPAASPSTGTSAGERSENGPETAAKRDTTTEESMRNGANESADMSPDASVEPDETDGSEDESSPGEDESVAEEEPPSDTAVAEASGDQDVEGATASNVEDDSKTRQTTSGDSATESEAGDEPEPRSVDETEPRSTDDDTSKNQSSPAAETNADSTGSDQAPEETESKPDTLTEEQEEAQERVADLLASANESKVSANELVAANEFAGAFTRIEAGVQACATARSLHSQYGVGDLDRIQSNEADLLDPAQADSTASRVRQKADDLLQETTHALDNGEVETANETARKLEALLAGATQLNEVTGRSIPELGHIRGQVASLDLDSDAALDDELDSQLAEAQSILNSVQTTLSNGELPDDIPSRIQEGFSACAKAADFNSEQELQRADAIASLKTELQAAAELYELAAEIDGKIASTRRAIDAREFEQAEASLEPLGPKVTECSSYDHGDTLANQFRQEVEECEAEIETEQAARRITGLFGSVGAAQSRAEEYLEDGSYTRAVTRLENALESLETAQTLAEQYDIDQQGTIAEKRESVEALLRDAQQRPEADLAAALETGEAKVAAGISHRETDNPAAAVTAFETAYDHYETALDITREMDLEEGWEVEQRCSMIAEYLEITQNELDDRARSLETDLGHQLEHADSTLQRAEQHAEVEDYVSAREELGAAVKHLDEATHLIQPEIIASEYVDEYDRLAERAETIHETLPEEDASGQFRTRDLVESLQLLATKLEESPTPEFVNAYGEYPADAYLDAFGSWPEALAAANLDPVDEETRDRRTYTRVEVLDALRDLAFELGHAPSKGDMNSHGAMSASPVTSRFQDWETALEIAGVTEEALSTEGQPALDSASDTTAETPDHPSPESPVVQPNELAELYEAFGSLESVLRALLSADNTVSKGDGSPLAQWYSAIFDRWAGAGVDGVPNYGEQQHRRNDFAMSEYREAYGDGTRITEFQAIATRPLRDSHHRVLVDRNVISATDEFSLPVAPTSDTRLPVAVRTTDELDAALELLEEFPIWPAAEKPPEDVEDDETEEAVEAEPPTGPTPQSDPDESEPDRESTEIVDKLMTDMGFQSDVGASSE